MQLSIVIPVYNVASYLEACLASVTQYTGPLEIIAVNDGATDDSPAILAQWAAKDARIRIISRENGLSIATIGLPRRRFRFCWKRSKGNPPR
jgi:glycosyltransferase involved in cell wall biosynthesis